MTVTDEIKNAIGPAAVAIQRQQDRMQADLDGECAQHGHIHTQVGEVFLHKEDSDLLVFDPFAPCCARCRRMLKP